MSSPVEKKPSWVEGILSILSCPVNVTEESGKFLLSVDVSSQSSLGLQRTNTTDFLLHQAFELMGAIKKKTQAINCLSCKHNCMCATLDDASDINENMIYHMWGN